MPQSEILHLIQNNHAYLFQKSMWSWSAHDTCIPSPCHFPISGYLLRTPDNSNVFLESSSYRWSTVFPDLLAGCFGPSCPKKRHPYYVRNESVYICTRTHTDASTAVPMLKTLTCGRKEYDCMCLQTQTYSLWTQVNGEASSEVKTVLVNKLN